MEANLSVSASRVQNALKQEGFVCEVVELSGNTRTAQEAAKAVGCEVGQIVKSLVFKGKKTGKAIFAAVSGSNRVNEKKLEEQVSEPVKMAHPDFVRKMTGFAIGGVPPIGHAEEMISFVDSDLMRHETIWAAAGTPHAMFRLTPDELLSMTRGSVIDLK